MPEIVGILADCVPTLGALMLTISGTMANYSRQKAESWSWTDSHGEQHSSGYNSYQTDFPDLTGWLNQNNNSGKSTAAGGGKKDKQGFGGSKGGSFK